MPSLSPARAPRAASPSQETRRAEPADQGRASLAEMHALAQRIAAFEIARETSRERMDRGDLRAKPHVLDLRNERRSARHEFARAGGEFGNRTAQRRRRLRRIQHFHRRAVRAKRVEGQINAIEALIVLSAILKVIDDLQRRAQSVGGRPHGRIFFMHVENETADRRRGQSAIVHQLRPVGVAVLPRVEPKGLQKVQRMFRAQAGLGELEPQGLGFVGRRPRPVSASSRSSRSSSFVSGDRVG